MLILSLPTEVIMEVFKNMGWRDILRASQTCRTFFEIAQDRSIWLQLLRDDSPTLLRHPILEAPIGEYTTVDLKNMVLRNISSTLGWNSARKPHERTTPSGDFPIGDGGKVLLDGGRWLLTFGSNLIDYNPEYDRAVLAYDLDSPRFAPTIIYKDTSPDHNMVEIFAQVDRSQSCLAFTVGLQFEDRNNFETTRFDVLSVEQRGRGPEAELVTSTIKSLSCEDVYDMFGDYYVFITQLTLGVPYHQINIVNWRISSITRQAMSTLHLELGALHAIRLLPENKILAIINCRIEIYRIPEFRWTRPLEVSLADGNFQQPIWSASLSPQVRNYFDVECSNPSYGPSATRLVFARDDQIYGLVIPHNGCAPAFHVLATAPALCELMRCTRVTVYIDKIYGEPYYELEASMLAFSWPEEGDILAQPMAWVPPVLHFTSKQFAGHHTSAMRGDDLVDDVSGRVVTGSKYETHEFPGEADGVQWSDITCWSVVDFFHPQFLPSSFRS